MPSVKPKPRAKTKPKLPAVRASSGGFSTYWGLSVPSHGAVSANEYTSLKVDTILACIRFIATSIAQIDFNVYETLAEGGKRYRPDHPVDWILYKEANPETDAMVFWETLLAHVLIWGNGYAEIKRDAYDRVQCLWQQRPSHVTMKRDPDTLEQIYEVRNDDGSIVVIPRRNMYHLRGLSWDGQVGYNMARLCRDVFGGAIATQDFANAYFENDATPGGVLSTPNTLSDPAYQRMQTSWEQGHRGGKRAHLIGILEEATTFTAISKDAQQSQLVETQQNAVEKIARIFGVPLTKIGHMIHSGNRANMEEDDRAAYKSCLRPWARKIECEADIKLFGRVNQGRLFTLHDFSVLLKGNSEQMTNQACQLLDRGVIDIDEARDWFDYNPIGEAKGGKTRPFPRNFTVLEKAGEDPKPSAGGSSGDAPGAGRSNQPPGTAQSSLMLAQAMPELAQQTFGLLLTDAYSRLLRVEADKAKRAGNKEQLGPHILGYYTEDGKRHVTEAIRPVVAALLLALGRPTDRADGFAETFAEDHAVRSITELCAGTWDKEWANGRATEQAQAHLSSLWESLR